MKKEIMKKIIMLFVICSLVLSSVGCGKNNENWYLNKNDEEKLTAISKGESQVIAFIDTGISDELADHLASRIIGKYNVLDKSCNVTDVHGHGTEMVSVACGDGYKGICGMSLKSEILIIKAVSDQGKTDNDNLYDALVVAESKGATIVNISLGGFKSDNQVVEQINKMIKKGITIVAAAGDYGNKDLLFPANQKGVISVEARGKDNSIWEDSNASDSSILLFPGEEINVLSIDEAGQLIETKINGTSLATAIASAYISLIKDYYYNKNMVIDNEKLIKILDGINSKMNRNIDFLQPFCEIKK